MMYVECFNDYEILILLGFEYKKDFKHSLGKGSVLKDMKKTSISLGIIDEDDSRGIYPQLQDYPVVDTQFNLSLRRNNDTMNKVLIQIPENLEKWFTRISSDLGIDPSNYGILDSFGKFKKRYINREQKEKFRQFLIDIQGHGSFQMLENWIQEYNRN